MKFIFIILLICPFLSIGQTINNQSGHILEIRIWKEGQMIDSLQLEHGFNHKIPSYNKLNPFRESYLLQIRYLNIKCPIVVKKQTHVTFFDGYYFNLMINDEFMKIFPFYQMHLKEIDAGNPCPIPQA